MHGQNAIGKGRALGRAVLAAAACIVALAGTANAQATSRDSTATLLWTAPGDDGNAGRATRYEMRARSVPVGSDTAAWWNSATPVTGLPAPSAAGATDSVIVRGLAPGSTWYFVLRTADEVSNWSGYSNVAIRPPYVDEIPPAPIANLAIASATLPLRDSPPVDSGGR